MTDVYYTSNPADYSKLEGLYVSEQNPPGFIQGADVSITGIAGKCVRGPTDHCVEITSPGRFLEVFGGRDKTANGSGGARIGEVHAALLNKKFGTVIVRRVAASDATKASHAFSDAVPTQIMQVVASSVGSWGQNITAEVMDASDGDANHFNLQVTYLGQVVTYQNLDLHNGTDNSAQVIGSDDGRLIDIVKTVDGRPVNGSSALATAGVDGTLAVTDYNAGVNDLAIYPGVSVVLVPEAVTGSAAAFHTNLVTLSQQVSDRIFLTWAQVHGQAVATETAQVAAQITTRTDRIWWCYNSAYTVDPDTGTELQQGPHVWLASILSQIDVDVHPGAVETQALLAGITRLTNTSLSRDDLIALRAAGISTLERLTNGFQFRSVVTTDLTAGKTEGTRRRMADFLQVSAAGRLESYVKAKNTTANRATLAAELTAFSQQLRLQGRIIQDFAIDQQSVNSDAQRAQGIEQILWRVDLIDHILALVFKTEIGTGVVIQQAA
jgi:hypothetical protein